MVTSKMLWILVIVSPVILFFIIKIIFELRDINERDRGRVEERFKQEKEMQIKKEEILAKIYEITENTLVKIIEPEAKERLKEDIPKTFTSSIGMKFVLIPAGKFMMGSEEYDSQKPVHRVKISKPFYLGTYPVTQKEWKSVLENNPSTVIGDNLPVVSISWNDVAKFIKKLNEKEGTDRYRLPSEAEWEYAARAGTKTRYSFGDDESKLGDYAWYNANSGYKTHDVGQKKPNPWGLYDMHGNVWEWVHDEWNDNYYGAPKDGSSSKGRFDRVVRGGGWCDGAGDCTSADRSGYGPYDRDRDLGFRLMKVS